MADTAGMMSQQQQQRQQQLVVSTADLKAKHTHTPVVDPGFLFVVLPKNHPIRFISPNSAPSLQELLQKNFFVSEGGSSEPNEPPLDPPLHCMHCTEFSRGGSAQGRPWLPHSAYSDMQENHQDSFVTSL